MNNYNLTDVSRHMQRTLQELCKAEVTVLSARIDMVYNTPTPRPFRFFIHAWNDANFTRWAVQYYTWENEQRHETSVPFLDGQVFVLND